MLGNPPSCSTTYEIRVRLNAEICWQEWFEGMTVTNLDNGDVLLTGPVVDQSALVGLLTKVLELDLTLIYAKKKNQ